MVRCLYGDDGLHRARFPTCGGSRHCRKRNGEDQYFKGIHGLLHHGNRDYPWDYYNDNLPRNRHLAPFNDALTDMLR